MRKSMIPLAVFCLLAFWAVGADAAWFGPTSAPPLNNVDAPLSQSTFFRGQVSGTYDNLKISVSGCSVGQVLTYQAVRGANEIVCADAVANATLLSVLKNNADARNYKGAVIMGSTTETWLNVGGEIRAGWIHATQPGNNTIAGNLGIGINSPAHLLHLKTASGNAEINIQSGNNNYWAVYQDMNSEDLRFYNADSAGGNVLTISNTGGMSVEGNVLATGRISNTTADNGQQIEPGQSYQSKRVTGLRFNSQVWRLYSGGPGSINPSHPSGESFLAIQDNGQINIGPDAFTASGDLRLDVDGKIGAQQYCDSNGANCKAITEMGGSSSGAGWTVSGNNVYSTNSGFVGVKTNAPVADLMVKGQILAAGTDYARMTLGHGTDNPLSTTVWVTDNNFFPANASWDKLYRIYPQDSLTIEQPNWDDYFMMNPVTGNVGIGIVPSDKKLDVDGAARIGGRLDVNGRIITGSNVGIGNSNPGQRLVIQNNTNDVRAAVIADAATSQAEVNLYARGGMTPDSSGNNLYAANLSNNRGNFLIWTEKGGNAIPFSIFANGANSRIGINLPLFTSAGQALDVNGNIRTNLEMIVGDGGRLQISNRANDFRFYADTYGDRFRIYNSADAKEHFNISRAGDVSIGSTAAINSSKLYVSGRTTAKEFCIENPAGGFTCADSTTGFGGSSQWLQSANGINYSGGNVGIGVAASPNSNDNLLVQKNSADVRTIIRANTINPATGKSQAEVNLVSKQGASLYATNLSNYGGDFALWTNKGGNAVPISVIANGANSKIGINLPLGTGPGQALEVNGNIRTNLEMIVGDGGRLQISNKANDFRFYADTYGDRFRIYNSADAKEHFNISRAGDVSIGSTAAINSSKLYVSGRTTAKEFCIENPAGGFTCADSTTGFGGSSQWLQSANGINYSGGNVGIGIVPSDKKLDVEGAVRIGGRLDVNGRIITGSNVGIGNTNPGQRLVIQNNTNDVRTAIIADAATSQAEVNLYARGGLTPDSSGNNLYATNLSNNRGNFLIWTEKGGNAIPFSITANGANSRIGINLPLGTTAQKTLDINGTGHFSDDVIIGDIWNAKGNLQVYGKDGNVAIYGFGGSTAAGGNPSRGVMGYSYDGVGVGGDSINNTGLYGTSKSGTGVEGFSQTGWAGYFSNNYSGNIVLGKGVFINKACIGGNSADCPANPIFNVNGSAAFNNGNVGIGTTNPSAKLHVVPSAGEPGVLVQTGTNYARVQANEIQFSKTGAGSALAYALLGTQDFSIYSENLPIKFGVGSQQNVIFLNTSGNVGLGTATPSSKLHVSGATNGSNPLVKITNTNTSQASLVHNVFEVWFDGGLGNPNLTRSVRITSNGTGYATNGWQTGNADYAEWFEKEQSSKPGDIIGINLKTGKVRPYRNGDKFIGIHSTAPGIVGNNFKDNDAEMAKTHTLVGLLGQLEFNKSMAAVEGGLVKTKDGQTVGVFLSGGKVLIGR